MIRGFDFRNNVHGAKLKSLIIRKIVTQKSNPIKFLTIYIDEGLEFYAVEIHLHKLFNFT